MLDHISLYGDISPGSLTEPDSAQVWKAELELDAARLRELEQFLSPDEVARANRFYAPRDRERFVAARGSLRVILGEYLNIKPEQVRFAYTPERKPTLADEKTLRFNLSHSDVLALIAVTQEREVGIDVERLRTDFDPDALAKRFFAPMEYAALLRVPPLERHRAFLALWVCKEAYLKACGTGLRQPLNTFVVSLEDYSITPNGPTGEGETLAPFRLHPLHPDPLYVAAMVLQVL